MKRFPLVMLVPAQSLPALTHLRCPRMVRNSIHFVPILSGPFSRLSCCRARVLICLWSVSLSRCLRRSCFVCWARTLHQRRMETPPLGLAEAFIAVGARTVVQKMWYDEEIALVDTVRLGGFPSRRFSSKSMNESAAVSSGK